MVNRRKSAWIVPAIGNNPTGPQLVGFIKQVDRIADGLKPGYKSEFQNAVKNRISQINSGNNNNNGMPKLAGTSMPPSQSTNNNANKMPKVFTGKLMSNDSYALSKAPNPRMISLKTGIQPNTFSNDYMTPVENGCSPLHMSGTYIQIPTAANNPLSSYFTNTICFDIQTRAQTNVGFGVDISSALSLTNMVTAFNDAIFALQVYFYYSSILSYESNSNNKNAGMIALRAGITSTILSDLSQLGKRLEDTPMPPRVVQWMRYMSGNFLSSNSQGSPMIKLFFDPQCVFGTSPAISFPQQALTRLSSENNNKVFTLLRRCIKEWRIGTLYDIPVYPMYDKDFLTIFANLPNSNLASGTTFTGNAVPDNITAIPYNSYNNDLDGLAFAMGSVYNTGSSMLIPGLAGYTFTSTTYKDTRYSYYNVAGVKQFYPSYLYPFLGASRQDTVTCLGTTNTTPHLFGTDKCQNVTGAALLQSAQNTLDFLFETKMIKALKRGASNVVGN